MKKNYFLTLLLTLCFSTFSFGQVTLPHYEAFDYTVGTDIASETNWENFSGSDNPIDVISDNLSYSGFGNSTGNAINLVGGFQDDRILFNEVTSGTVYASFLLKVTDISSITDFTDGAYFAMFGSTTNSFRSRFWVKPTVDASSTTVDFAYTNASSGSGFGESQNLNSVVLVVMSYNVDSGEMNAWINPDSSSFEAGSAPTADLTNTDGSPTSIDRFMLRQDSTGETPNMVFDELRLGTTWASVTPSGTVSNDPTLTINSPSNNQTIDATNSVDIKITVTNFNVASGGSGDGFIKWKLNNVDQADKTDTNDETITVSPGNSYDVYMELVDNSGNPLSTPVNQTITFSINNPCDLVLADISATCDALTSGADTYNGSIDFTGGNTGVNYTITAKDSNDNDVGTIGGDNPNSATSGKITVTGIPEGTNVTVKIVGGTGSSCDLTRTLFSPVCIPFPVVDTFDYTADTDLTASANWQTTSGSTDKVKVVTGTIGNPFSPEQFPNPTGNMVSFDGGGADPYIEFNQQNSGTVYASFIFTATDISGLTNTNGGYFAVLTQASGSYRGRLWLRQDTTDNTKYNVGVTAGSSGATYHTTMHTPGEEIFIVMGYDFATNDLKVWIDPDPASFSGTIPTETLKVTASGNDIPTDLGRFLLRQDSGTETPSINFDELRISTSWADVTPKGSTASVGENPIEGFAAYPNPVRSGRLTITSATSDIKTVSIYNVLGRKVFTETISGTSKQLNIASIKSGVYILKVVEGNKSSTKKLVIR